MRINFLKRISKKVLAIILGLSFFLSPLAYVYADNHNTNNNGNSSSRDNAIQAAAVSVTSCLALFGGSYLTTRLSGLLDVPVSDAGNTSTNTTRTMKECSLDAVANGVKRFLIRTLVDATIEWINNGFDGKPAFGRNLKRMVEDTKNQILEDVIYGAGLGGLCTGFELPVKFALQLRFNLKKARYTSRCTIDKIKENIDRAVKDVENFYSWNNFLEVTTNSENNTPFGVYFSTSKDIQRAVSVVNKNLGDELKQNNGFLSMRRCNDEYNKKWRDDKKSGSPRYDGSDFAKANCQVVTPGTLLSAKLNKAVGSEEDEIITADEFDEIISALIGQLFKRLAGGGVTGFSESSIRYSSVQDPALAAHKRDLIKQFNPKSYDIGIKILESRDRTIKNAQNVYNNNVVCWNKKQGEINKDSIVYKEVGTNNDYYSNSIYMVLTQNTVSNADSHLTKLSYQFRREAQKTKYILDKFKKDRERAGEMQELIWKAKNFTKLQEVLNNSETKGVDLIKEQRDNVIIGNKFNDIVNGNREYGTRGIIKKGGIGEYLRYCDSFDLVKTAGDGRKLITEQSSLNDLTKLNNSKNISIMDSYDPTDEIDALNFSDDFWDSANYSSSNNNYNTLVCEDSSTIKCMGDLDTALSGEKADVELDSNKTHIYTIPPENRKTIRGTISVLNQNLGRIRLSLTEDLTINSMDAKCNETADRDSRARLIYNTVTGDVSYSDGCNLDENKTFFLRVGSVNGVGQYTINTVGSGDDRIGN